MRNPVARNNKHKGGPFKKKDKDAKAYVNQKIKKELDKLDDKWIDEEINEHGRDTD
ncbi:MAG: hypothetical protein ACREAE_01930 [Nitrosopumilaceae archaeon]